MNVWMCNYDLWFCNKKTGVWKKRRDIIKTIPFKMHYDFVQMFARGRPWAIVRADGVVIAQSKDADLSGLREAA